MAKVKLTDKQTKVLRLIAEGKKHDEIAEILECSTANIRNFVDRLKLKFKAESIANIVYIATKNGVI